MTDTYGPTSRQPFATYDPVESCWKTSEVTSLWALTLSSLTLPTWGCLHGGELYELPTPALPTIERGFSSLLATPTTMDNLPARQGEAYEKAKNYGGRKNRKATGNLREQVVHLPTPNARDYKGSPGPGWSGQASLPRAVSLLPTPAVNDMGARKDPQAWDEWTERMKETHGNGNGHGKSLEQEALRMLPTPKSSRGGAESTTTRPSGSKGSVNLHGAITHPPSTAGSTSQDDPHQPPLFPTETVSDSTPPSSNG